MWTIETIMKNTYKTHFGYKVQVIWILQLISVLFQFNSAFLQGFLRRKCCSIFMVLLFNFILDFNATLEINLEFNSIIIFQLQYDCFKCKIDYTNN